MAEYFAAGGFGSGSDGNEFKTLAGHERCQVVLHMNVESLQQQHDEGGSCCYGHEEYGKHEVSVNSVAHAQ